MKEIGYKCDVCGRVKSGDGQWFMAVPDIEGREGQPVMVIGAWAERDRKIDLCGEECAHKFLGHQLAKWTEKT